MRRPAAWALAAGLAAVAPAGACELELVIALDVSLSVTDEEFELMRAGTADAFLADDVIRAIEAQPGGIMVSVFQWSASWHQETSLDWQPVAGRADAVALAERIVAMPRSRFAEGTAPGNALIYASRLADAVPVTCRRKVVDIVGDGIRNMGADPAGAADAVLGGGGTVNALVILGAYPDPHAWYLTHVVRGPFAFAEVAADFDDFGRAMHRKLLREIGGMVIGEVQP